MQSLILHMSCVGGTCGHVGLWYRVIIQPRKGIMPIYGFGANKITCMVPADYYIVLKLQNKTQFVQNKFNIHENITTIICKQGIALVSM